MTTPSSRRARWPLALVGVVVIAGAVAALFVWRDRIRPAPAVPDMAPASVAMTSPSEAPKTDARVGVNIDARRQQLIGVRLATVERTLLAPTIRAVGQVRYDETRLADVNLKLEGWIEELNVDYTGRFVRRGERLFTFYSPELLATQNEYLLALRTRDQTTQSQVADARDYAERIVQAARQRLTLWELSPEQIRALEETRQPQRSVPFVSPVSGYVLEKAAIEGMHVIPGQMLYKIADLSSVWVEADVYEQDAPLVRVGQRAIVTLDAYPGEQFPGRATYVYPFVEEKTRTVKVRFQLSNAQGRLKPGMYANVELMAPGAMGLMVPADALLDSGTKQVVFVAMGDGYFEPRPVKAGRRFGDTVEITEGLKEGEQVASGATFFLDSESQLRAAVQGFETPQSAPATAAAPGERIGITFRLQPDPPRVGENVMEVSVRDASGQPISDAGVSVIFFMAAMPVMNMPAVRNEATLPPVGGGAYRGLGQVTTAGRWDVTVTVTRGGARLGSQQFAIVAR